MPIRPMHRLLPRLIVILAFAIASGMTRSAHAQAFGADAGSCAPVERELAAARRETEAAKRESAATERKAEQCASELASSSSKLQESSDATSACEQGKSHVCSATAALVDDIARGKAGTAGATGCVTPEQQSRLDAMVTGVTGTTTFLSQLAAYQAGETDTLPGPRNGATALDRAVQRLVRASGEKVLHRRLLVEAVALIAPQAWAAVRAKGVPAIDAWFASKEPLDAEMIKESQRAHSAAPGVAGPPLTAALSLVRAFQVAAHCNAAAGDGGECARARQLQQLLESSGTLVIRRRVQ